MKFSDQITESRKEMIRKWLKESVSPDRSMSMIENPPPAGRLELVKVWLEDNVVAPPTPSEITIYGIDFDWEHLRGSFRLTLDNLVLKDRFDLSIDIAGQVQFCPPMFHSPLGAPASYVAVSLNSETSAAVSSTLKTIFPRLRGYGLYEDLGLEIYGDSPLEDRIIDRAQFTEMTLRLHSRGFQVKAKVGAER
jgi:hypothetical protein